MQNEAIYTGRIGIESILHFPAYASSGMQPAEEPEDPPEALHLAWGLWLHHRDALHRIEQKHDINHVLRNARAADDILHYLDYVPKIGHDGHNVEIFQTSFGYDYLHEEQIYNINLEFEEENDAETAVTGLERESANFDEKDERTDNHESDDLLEGNDSKDDAGHELKKDLIEILKICELESWECR